jgi:hypothetical protein
MTKKVTVIGKRITPKQWSGLILELNIMKQAWRPYADIEIEGTGVKKIIKSGTFVKKP